MPMGPCTYIFLRMDAVLVNHQSGSSGCLCVCELVFAMGAHGGGWTWSMLSFMYLANCSMKIVGGMLCGVGKVFRCSVFEWFCQLLTWGSYKSSLGPC